MRKTYDTVPEMFSVQLTTSFETETRTVLKTLRDSARPSGTQSADFALHANDVTISPHQSHRRHTSQTLNLMCELSVEANSCLLPYTTHLIIFYYAYSCHVFTFLNVSLHFSNVLNKKRYICNENTFCIVTGETSVLLTLTKTIPFLICGFINDDCCDLVLFLTILFEPFYVYAYYHYLSQNVKS